MSDNAQIPPIGGPASNRDGANTLPSSSVAGGQDVENMSFLNTGDMMRESPKAAKQNNL